MLGRMIDLWSTSRGFRTGSMMGLAGLAGVVVLTGLMHAGGSPSTTGNDPFNAPDDTSDVKPVSRPRQDAASRGGDQGQRQAASGSQGAGAGGQSPGSTGGTSQSGPAVGALAGTWTRRIKTRDQTVAYTVELDGDGTGEEIYNPRGASTEIGYKYVAGTPPHRGTLSFSAMSRGKLHPRETGEVTWIDADHFTYRITSTTRSVNEVGWKYTFERH
jgi:hypothetical protein